MVYRSTYRVWKDQDGGWCLVQWSEAGWFLPDIAAQEDHHGAGQRHRDNRSEEARQPGGSKKGCRG